MTSTPTRVQYQFRYRTDADAVDNTPTWGAAENTDYSPATATNFRLRFTIRNTGSGNTGNEAWSLRYSHNGGAYTAITTTSSVVKSVDAGSSADNATLATQRLSNPPSGTFINGQYDESGATGNINITAGNYTEVEYGLQIVNADVSHNDTIDFRVYAAGAALQTYTVTPRSTVAKIVACDLTSSIGTITLSSDTDVLIQATATNSIGTITLASDVDVLIQATATNSIGEIALASDTDVIVGGALSASIGDITLSTDADVIVGAALTSSVGDITLSASASISGAATESTQWPFWWEGLSESAAVAAAPAGGSVGGSKRKYWRWLPGRVEERDVARIQRILAGKKKKLPRQIVRLVLQAPEADRDAVLAVLPDGQSAAIAALVSNIEALKPRDLRTKLADEQVAIENAYIALLAVQRAESEDEAMIVNLYVERRRRITLSALEALAKRAA